MTAAGRPSASPVTCTSSAVRHSHAVSAAGSYVLKTHASAHRVRGSVGERSRWRCGQVIGAQMRRTARDHHRGEHQAVTAPLRGTVTWGRRF